jgi:hypothetical protein
MPEFGDADSMVTFGRFVPLADGVHGRSSVVREQQIFQLTPTDRRHRIESDFCKYLYFKPERKPGQNINKLYMTMA